MLSVSPFLVFDDNTGICNSPNGYYDKIKLQFAKYKRTPPQGAPKREDSPLDFTNYTTRARYKDVTQEKQILLIEQYKITR